MGGRNRNGGPGICGYVTNTNAIYDNQGHISINDSPPSYIPATTKSITRALENGDNVGVALDGIAGMFPPKDKKETIRVGNRKGTTLYCEIIIRLCTAKPSICIIAAAR